VNMVKRKMIGKRERIMLAELHESSKLYTIGQFRTCHASSLTEYDYPFIDITEINSPLLALFFSEDKRSAID
jgi:hypothetical protein